MAASGDPPATTETLTVALLDGRYDVDTLLGRGAVGVVYRALDTRLDRYVAVKWLREGEGADRGRFAEEVRTLARFTHPNLVRLLDAGEIDGRAYIVMDLVDGPTLAARLRDGPLPPAESARAGAGIAGALAYVHGEGVVHRDVKPANILIGRDGTAYLADFGIARLVDTNGMTATGVVLGTPAYLAPEQIRGTDVGPAADVYALGLVLIECLSGKRAFPGTVAEMTTARLHVDPPLPAGLGPSWKRLLETMTSTNPGDRVPAAEAATQLSKLALDIDAWTPVTGLGLLGGDATAELQPRAGDTLRLDPAKAMLEGNAGATVVYDALGAPESRRGFPARAALIGAAALAALGIVLALTLGGLLAGSRATRSPHGSAHGNSVSTSTVALSSTTTTSTTSTTTTTTTAPLTVASTAGSLVAALEAGITSGEVSAPAGRQLVSQLQPLLVTSASGPPQQRTQQFDQLVQSYYGDVANAQVTGGAVPSLRRALTSLAGALGTAVPSPTTTTTTTTTTLGPPGGSGDGNGPGKGNGNGPGKGNGKGNDS